MKRQPVVGIVYHANDSTSESTHSHRVYLMHIHNFSGITSLDVGHRHYYAGTTEPAPSGVPHTHEYLTVTSFDVGHTHIIEGETGPAIPLPGGGHYHVFKGTTSENGRTPHTHEYSGRTSPEIPYRE